MAFKAGSIYGEAELNTKKWSSGLSNLNSSTKKGVGTLVKGVGAGMLAVGAVVAAGLGKAVMVANEFQKEMANVSTVIDTTKISTQDMTKSLLGLDPALGSTTELTKGMYNAFSAGAEDAEEALEITTNSAKFAKAGLTDLATATDVLTTATNAYGKDQMDTTKASDLFFKTIEKGKITGEQLAGSIGQSIPLFASTGIELEQLTAGMAAMTKQGISANESTTQLNAIVNSVLKPSEAMAEAMAGIGYESGSAMLEAEGLAGVLKLVEDQTGGDATAMQKLIPNIRGLKGAMALTGVGGEEFRKTLVEMESATGATDIAFAKQEKTFETLKTSMDKNLIVIGNIGKGFVDEIAGGATEAAESMLSFIMSSSGAELVGNLVGGVAGGFQLLKEFMSPIIDSVGPAMSGIFESIGELMATFSDETDGTSGAMNLFSGVSQFAASAVTVLGKGIEFTITNITNLIKVAQLSGDTLKAVFTGKWGEARDSAKEAAEALKGFGTGVVEGYADMFSTVGDQVVNFGDKVSDTSLQMETSVVTSFKTQKTAMTSNWDAWVTGQAQTVDAVSALMVTASENAEDEGDNQVEDTKDTTAEIVDTWEAAFSDLSKMSFEWGQQTADMAGEAMGLFGSMMGGFADAQVNEKQAAYDLEEKALQEKLDNELITQEQFDAQKLALDESQGKALDAAKKEAFEADKSNQIAGAWINAASSIMGWWANAPQLGPIAGPAFAGTMSALAIGAAMGQTAAISSQQYVPSFASGGTMPFTGMAQVNEKGGEIMKLPGGTTIIPNDISRDIASSSGGDTIVNFNGGTSFNNRSDIDYLVNQVSKKLGRRMKSA